MSHSSYSLRTCCIASVCTVFVIMLTTVSLHGKGKWKAWRALSRPEKCWSIVHPIKARTVYECAKRARYVTDSLRKAEVLTDDNGGQLDAFRHAYWMALMIDAGIHEKVARRVGQKHERGNYLDFKKGKLEEGLRTDSLASVMDLRNNDVGIQLGKKYSSSGGKLSLIEMIMTEIADGKLWILKKDAEGNYRTCENKQIDLTLYGGKWFIPKCLVSSNEIVVEH